MKKAKLLDLFTKSEYYVYNFFWKYFVDIPVYNFL